MHFRRHTTAPWFLAVVMNSESAAITEDYYAGCKVQ